MLFEFSDVIQGAFVAYVASGPTPSYQQRAREALGILEYLWDFTDLDKSGSKFREVVEVPFLVVLFLQCRRSSGILVLHCVRDFSFSRPFMPNVRM